MTKIAMLGAGAMGSRVALNFLKNNYEVTVYNRSADKLTQLREAGAKTADTPREAVADADFVFSMVRDDAASREVWLAAETGAIHNLAENAVAVESGTVTPAWIRELAAQVGKTKAALLEAPVLGTRPQAEAGQLIYLVGGDENVLEKVREVLLQTSAAIHYLGAHGAAAAMKLAVNSQYAAQVAIWAETLTLLENQGIANEKAVEILNTLPTTSAALQIGGKLIAAKNYNPLFPIELVAKDLNYALALARSAEIEPPTLAAVHALFAAAESKGFGGDNIVGVRQLFEK